MIERVRHEPAFLPTSGLSAAIGPGRAQWAFLASLALGLLVWWPLALPALVWGFLNDFEPAPPYWYGPKHQPGRPTWWVWVAWYLRNPFQNAGRYGFGVSHRAYDVIGSRPVYATLTREWAANEGLDPLAFSPWKWSVLWFGWRFPIPLPYVAYDGPKWRFYAGWQHVGFAGFKFHPKGSNIQVA